MVAKLNTWYFVAEVVNSSNINTLYVNGNAVCSYDFSDPGTETSITIGSYYLVTLEQVELWMD